MDEHASFETRAVLEPRRRGRNRLGIVVAAIAVVATVGAGLLGQRLQTEPVAEAPSPRASDGAAVALASPASGSTPSNDDLPSLPGYPTSVLGLPVQAAAYVERSGDGGGPDGYGSNGLVAVSGWFAAQPGTGCPTARIAEDPALAAMFGVSADPDTFCDRAGTIFSAPMFGEHAPPIKVQLRPGVAAPYALRSVATVSPVVLVGRFANAAPPCGAPRNCEAVLMVDRVAWSGGHGLPRTPSVLPRLLAYWPPLGSPGRDRLVTKAIGDTGEVLIDTLVDDETLARIDPAAARLLAIVAPTVDRIWYRRVLGVDPARDPMLWVAVDDATGNVIGSGAVEG